MHGLGLNYIGHRQDVITPELRMTFFRDVWIISKFKKIDEFQK